MPDITELLVAAARRPAHGPDLDAVAARAVAQRRQTAAVRAAAAVLVLAGLLPVALRSDDALSLREVDQPAGPQVTSSPTATGAASRLAAPAQTAAPSAPAAAASAASPVRDPSASPTPAPPTGPPSPSPRPGSAGHAAGGPPEAPSCEVTTRGLAPTLTASCAFTATRAGGYATRYGVGAGYVNARGSTVVVTRPGRAPVSYDIADADCHDAAVLPGDVVEVTVRQPDRSYVEIHLGAGEGHACRAAP